MPKEYYRLVKPGIVYGNTLTTLAAFLFASRWHFALPLFVATMSGIALVIASACVFNNYLDRELDAKMSRTKERALVRHAVSDSAALTYASALFVIGFGLLYALVNVLTALIALFGFCWYVLVYTFAKRHTHWGTVIGSVAGAVPIVVGYTAPSDRLDLIALVLFFTLALWQMPHFYAIALRRHEEYDAAGVPVLPLVRGARTTKLHILTYIVAYAAAASSLALIGRAGYVYLALVLLSSLGWLYVAFRGLRTSAQEIWARSVFFASLVVLFTYCIALAFGATLP